MAEMPQDMRELVDTILGTAEEDGLVEEPGNDLPDEVFNLATMVREFFRDLPDPVEPEPITGTEDSRWLCELVARDHRHTPGQDRQLKYTVRVRDVVEPEELRGTRYGTSEDAAIEFMRDESHSHLLRDNNTFLVRVSQLGPAAIHRIERTVDVEAKGVVASG